MINLELTQDELPIVANIIESAGRGIFVSKVKRYLRDIINSVDLDKITFTFNITIDDWVAMWLLSTLYASEVAGPSASFMYKLEDAMSSPIIEVSEKDTAPQWKK